MRKFLKSFSYAFSGLIGAVRSQRNLRFHLVMAAYVTISGFCVGLRREDWKSILLCFALVVGAELINTAIEKLCDAVHPQKSDKIRLCKDAAAGAVLVCAVFSAIIGCLIFFNRETLAAAGVFIQSHTVLTLLVILSVIPAIFFVIGRKKNDH